MSVECAFGINSAKFRILLKPIETGVKNVVSIVKAICILHNTIIDMEQDAYTNVLEDNVIRGNHNLQFSKANNRTSRAAENAWNIFCEYFSLNQI